MTDQTPPNGKLRIATCSLAGCFGCHMSFLDIDESIQAVAELAEFDRSPLTDYQQLGVCDIGLIEGGLCNEENLHTLTLFRRQCRVLVAVGACAVTGGIPAMRNRYSLTECLQESFFNGIGVDDPQIPNDPELPLLLDKVRPLQEWVKIDISMPGCPPPPEAFIELVMAVREGRDPDFSYAMRHFD